MELMSSTFRGMEYKLAMSILDPKINFTEQELSPSNSFLTSLDAILSPYDMDRLEAYTNNLADYHMILDLVPRLALLYFQGKLPVTLSYAQASVLLCMGLKRQDVTYMEGAMKLERQQILSLFIKVMKKFHKYLYSVASKEIDSKLPRLKEVVMLPHNVSVDDDLDEGAQQVKDKMKADADGLLNPELLQQYAIVDKETEFEKALLNGTGKISSSGLISVKSNRTSKTENYEKQKESNKSTEKRRKDSSGSRSHKKKRSSSSS